MIWLTSFSFAVLLFTYQHDLVESRKKSSNSSNSLWGNPAKANNFMKCLIQKIGSSAAFSLQEKEDMESLVETMMAAMSGMSNSKGNSAATLQAMNMAFASSMAELVIAEDLGATEGIAVKTEALAQALNQCFRSTMGSVNRHFITEIKDLIGLFAREATKAVENDMDDEEDDGEKFGGDYSLNVDSVNGDMDLVSGNYPSVDPTNQLGGSASGDVSSQDLESTFANSDLLKEVFINRISPNAARNDMGSAIQDISNGINLHFNISSPQLNNDVMRALANARSGSEVKAYIKAIVPAISRALTSTGILNTNTNNKVSPQITMGITRGVASAFPRNRINVDNINLQNNLLQAKKLNDQRGQSVVNYKHEGYATGFDSYGAYPGELDSISAYDEGVAGVDMQLSGTSGSSGSDISSKFATTQLDSPQTSLSTGGHDVTGSYSSGLDVTGAYPGGLDSTGVYQGGNAGVDTQLSGTSGSLGSDLSLKFATSLGNALLQSDIFRGAFKRGISPAAAGGLLNIALQQTAAVLRLDASTSSNIRNSVLQALTSLPQGTTSNAYAQAIVTAFANVLDSINKLNDRNAKLLSSKIATALVKSVSVNADRYGITLPGINLDNDLQKVNASMNQFNSPQTSLSAGGGDDRGSYSGGLDTTGEYSGGLDSTGVYQGGNAGIDMQLSGTSGSLGSDLSSKFATKLGNALLQSDTFRGAFKRGISPAAAGGLLNIALQQIAADLRLDASTSGQVRSAILKAVTTVPQNSDSNAYAQAIATAFANVLDSTNKLDRNAKLLSSKIVTALIKSVSANASRYGITLPGINLDNDLQKVNAFMNLLDSPQTSLSTGGHDVTGSYSSGLDVTGAYPGGLDSTGDYQGGNAGVDMQLSGISGSLGSDLFSKFATTLGNALLQSDTFRGAFKTGISPAAAGGILNIALQQTAADMRLDASTSSQIRNAILKAVTTVSQVPAYNAYAQAIASAFANVLDSFNKLNDRNAKLLSSKIATALVKSVSVNADRYGITLQGINLDNDLQKVNAFMNQLDSQQKLLSVGGGDDSGSYSGGLDTTGEYSGGLDSTGVYQGGNAGIDMQLSGISESLGTDLSSKFATTLFNALLQSDTFRGAFKRGISPAAAGGLLNIALQQIATDLRLDASTSGQVRSAILKAVTTIPQGSDSNSYAQAIATAFANVLDSTNKLDRNAKLLSSKIVTALVKSVSVNASRYGITLPGINLDNDLQKVNAFMNQLDSPQTSLSTGGHDVTGSYSSGLDVTGAYPGGLDSTGVYQGVNAGVDMQLSGTSGSLGSDLSSKFATSLGNALLQSDIFRGAFKRGISPATAGGLLNIALQQTAAVLRLDASTSSNIRNSILQAVTSLPQGTASNEYAQAIATAFANVLDSINKLNVRNAKLLSSKIATALVKSISVNADRYGITLPGINLDNDLQKVNAFMNQLDSPQTLLSVGGGDDIGSYSGGLDTTGEYSGDLDSTGVDQGGNAEIDMQLSGTSGSLGSYLSSKFSTTLGNALLQSDTFRGAFKRGISPDAAGGLLNIALRQIAADLRLDASTSGQVRSAILKAVSTVPQDSDSNAYAKAIAPTFANVLVSTNKLNERNAKLLSSKIATALVKSVSVNASRYGIRLPGINLDNEFQKVNTILVQLNSPLSPLSMDGYGDTGSYSGGWDATGAYPGIFDLTGAYSMDYQDNPNFNLHSVEGDSGQSVSGSGISFSLGSILNSPNGLKSRQANSRISGLTSSLVRAFGPNGFDPSAFAVGLKGTMSQLRNSEMSSDQAMVEGLMEALVALVQILNSSQIGQVNTSTMSSTSNLMVRALSLILV